MVRENSFYINLVSNTHTYTPYTDRYCPLCLSLQTPGDETHTLLHCPHSSPLTQTAIHNFILQLRQFDLWIWTTYTDTQKVSILLGDLPLQLARQHEKSWTLLTFPTYTQLIYSLQAHSRLTQPPVPPLSPPSPLNLFDPRLTTYTVRCVRTHLTNTRYSSVTYVTHDDIWTDFSHP